MIRKYDFVNRDGIVLSGYYVFTDFKELRFTLYDEEVKEAIKNNGSFGYKEITRLFTNIDSIANKIAKITDCFKTDKFIYILLDGCWFIYNPYDGLIIELDEFKISDINRALNVSDVVECTYYQVIDVGNKEEIFHFEKDLGYIENKLMCEEV